MQKVLATLIYDQQGRATVIAHSGVGWLVSWLVSWLVGWLRSGWLVGWLVVLNRMEHII